MIQQLFFLFLIAFPKGGFKIGNVPITWGYLLLLLLLLSYPFTIRNIEKTKLFCFLSLIPFQVVAIVTLLCVGSTQNGFALSLIVSFILIPFIAYFMPYSIRLEKIPPLLLFVAAYGIFLFFFKLLTGHFIEVPFLTTNYHDLGQLELKHIDRGAFFKLISTYNNGNLYGICQLMMLPLYEHHEKKLIKRLIIKLSMILTLSRTVWVGLLFYEIFFAQRRTFKILFSCLAIYLLSVYFPFGKAFFVDTSLGGRLHHALFRPAFFSNQPFDGIGEMVYPHMMQAFGVVGLLAFLLGMLAPIFWRPPDQSSEQRALTRGLIIYLFVAISDGAILYIPTMCFYWMLSSFSLGKATENPSKNWSERPSVAAYSSKSS